MPLAFVSVEPLGESFEAKISLDGMMALNCNPESLLKDASRVYANNIRGMRQVLQEIEAERRSRKRLMARTVWRVGDTVHGLVRDLAELDLQIDGIYDHLCRDLNVKRKWLEKVIIFRRYIPREDAIPETLNWGRCEKGTRRCAERLGKGLPVA